MRVSTIAVNMLLCALAAAPAAAAQNTVPGPALLTHLTGTWRAPEERTPRSTELDEQVFGKGAADLRTVTLVVSPSGDATLQIHRSVIGSRGKIFAPSLTEAKMHIGEPVVARLGHLEPTVSVTSAEERYLDGDHEHWSRDGSRVSLSVVDMKSNEINLQFDTPDGRGAFGATLIRRP